MSVRRSRDTSLDSGYSNYISEKKSFRFVSNPANDNEDRNQEGEEEDDDKTKPYTAVGAAVTSAERFRRRMNYGRVKKTNSPRKVNDQGSKDKIPNGRKSCDESGHSRTDSSTDVDIESANQFSNGSTEIIAPEKIKYESSFSTNSYEDERRKNMSRKDHRNETNEERSKNKSMDELNSRAYCGDSADLRKKYPHWYDREEKRAPEKSRSIPRGRSPIQSQSPKKQTAHILPIRNSSIEKKPILPDGRRKSYDGDSSFSDQHESVSSTNSAYERSVTGSSDKYSRYSQEEKKQKSATNSTKQGLSPAQRYARRKSYDASSSRVRTPLPDLRNIRSSGYARVERDSQGSSSSQSWSGGSSRGFLLLPSVES